MTGIGENAPVRFGILGAANIAPMALITPALSHPEAVVYAVAARNLEKAQKFAKKHGIEKVYGGPQSYQGARELQIRPLEGLTWVTELLDDPNVDAVYNPVRIFEADTLMSI